VAGTQPRNTTVEDASPRWADAPATRSVNRGSAAGRTVTRETVAERRARALSGGKSKTGGPKRDGTGKEVVANTLGLVWIVSAAIVVVLCVFFLAGSVLMMGILSEISRARDFDAAIERDQAYQDYFAKIAAAGFKVIEDEPSLVEGVKQYLWTVLPPGEQTLRVFSWSYNMQTNEYLPTSNAALLLDLKLDYIKTGEAEKFANGFTYQPDDPVAEAMLKGDVTFFAANNPNGWGAQQETAPPLPPPLFDPKKGKRGGSPVVASAEEGDEEETAEGDPTEGEVAVEGEQPPAAEDGQNPEPEPPAQEVEDPEPPIEVEPEPPVEDDGGGEPEPEPEPEPAPEDDGDATPVR
jgi:hypothetical protein